MKSPIVGLNFRFYLCNLKNEQNFMKSMFRKVLFVLSLLLVSSSMYGQIAVKTNVPMDVLRIPNIGFELGISKKITLDVPLYYNPWKFSDDKQLKLSMVQPEIRYWLCDKFNGHFFGVHGMVGNYQTTGIDLPFSVFDDLDSYRYKGNFWGAGISYGYQFLLGEHWNLEATLGFGYARVSYKKYECKECPKMEEESDKNYFGPTKAALSLIYLF
mgnify:FL=1